MTGRDGYELDMSSPVSHVAAEMERAAPSGAALTVKAMAATYRHPLSSDLVRIRREENLGSDEEAVLWLVRAAIGELGRQVTRDGDGYRLRRPFSELKWKRRPVRRPGGDDHARLGDPFNPMTGGIFAGNVRIGKGHKRNPPEDAPLRESMRQNGWLPGHPAIIDERGVIITGHRRLKIAAELGNIEPDIMRVTFGSGDAADIARLRTAWFSNEGVKTYNNEDRKAVSAYLAARGWTQASIAEALHVAQNTISRDLQDQEVIIHSDNYQDHDGKRKNKAGAGRPRKLTEDQQAVIIGNFHEFGGTMTASDLMEELGQKSNAPILKVIDQERGARNKNTEPAVAEASSLDLVKELISQLPAQDRKALVAWLQEVA